MTINPIPATNSGIGFFDNWEIDDLEAEISAPKKAIASVPVVSNLHFETCPACRGTGQFRSYTGRVVGQCYKCKGKGERVYKNSAPVRADNRAKAATRKASAMIEALEAFKAAHADIWEWIEASPDFEFARAMRDAVAKYGSLTEKQLAACQRCADRRKAQHAARNVIASAAPVIDMSKLVAAFKEARSHILFPKMRLAGFVITMAGSQSRNPGALYFKSGETYLGKVIEGKFLRSKECSDTQQNRIVETANDPLAAAIAYGKEYGICACCGLTLTNPESIARGIGPICAKNFGF